MTRFDRLLRHAVTSYQNIIRGRRYARVAKRAEKRRAVLMEQIEYRRVNHREFRPLYGSLRDSTHEALAAECGREWPDRIKESW